MKTTVLNAFRSFTIPALVVILLAAKASAAEYLIQVEEIKSTFASSKSDDITKQESISSTELRCELGKPAATKVTIGKMTISAEVLVKTEAKGVLAIAFFYHTSEDTGNTIPDEKGIRKPLPRENALETELSLRLDERFEMGGLISTKNAERTKQTYVITAKEYKPETK